MSTGDAASFGVIVGTIIMTVVGLFAENGQDNSWRDQIVNHGGARYYLDANHVRQWQWIDRPSVEVRP